MKRPRLLPTWLKKSGYIDNISLILCIVWLRYEIRHQLSFNGKIGKNLNLSLIYYQYRIQSDISESKRRDTKNQTKIIEEWVQNANINFKQSFKISKLCKVKIEISIKNFTYFKEKNKK